LLFAFSFLQSYNQTPMITLRSESESAPAKHGKLLYRLFKWILSAALVLTLILILAVYLPIRPLMEEREAQLQHEAALRSSRLLKDYIVLRTSELRTIASAPGMSLMEYERQKSLAQGLLKIEPSFVEVSVADSKGREFIRMSQNGAATGQDMVDFSDSPSFAVVKRGTIYAGGVKFSPGGEPLQEMAVPVERDGEFVGMLAGTVRLFPVSEELASFRTGKTGISYIVDSDGRLLAHYNLKLLPLGNLVTGRNVVKRTTEGKETRAFEEDSVYTNEKGKKVAASSILVNDLGPGVELAGGGYGVIVEREVSEALEPLWLLIRLIAVISAGSMLLMAAAIMMGSRWILTPLQQLHEGAMALGAGILTYRVDIKSGDELEALGESFNNMAERLQKAMNSLADSEAQFRAIVENMAEGLVLVDKDGIDIYVNPSFARLTGYEPEQFIGKKAGSTSMSTVERERVRADFPLRKRGLVSVREVALVSKIGEKIPVLLSGAPIFDPKGSFQGSVAMFTDLREMKKLEQERGKMLMQTQETLKALSASEATFRSIVENMSEGLSLRDKGRNLMYANPALCRMLGYTREELATMKNFMQIVASESREEVRRRSRELWEKEVSIVASRERVLLTKSGEEIPAMVATNPVLDSEGKFVGTVGIFTDLRELKRLQEEREKMLRLAAIGEIAAVVSHEFRNSLGAISNSLYVLRSRVKDPDYKVERNLVIISQAIASSTRIISNLLDFARPKEPSLRPVFLNEIVNEAVSAVGFPDAIRVSLDLDASMPAVKGDREMLRRVVMNLLLNAADAMQGCGNLRVTTALPDGCAEVRVNDTGAGIYPDVLAKIFDPFFTTKAKGTGLGLYVSKQIMEKHGGSIEVESQAGKGSTFIVRLPAGGGSC